MSRGVSKKIYFSDYFDIPHKTVDEYGALDISLICDNPAFVDPFLLFANEKYRDQHDFIINYLKFLRDLSIGNSSDKLSSGIFKNYYRFSEVEQAWLGYSIHGNSGLGLGRGFAESLNNNLQSIFSTFGEESVTNSSHLEKLCLIEKGVGVDKISDFTLNLIKEYLLKYTEAFAKEYIDENKLSNFAVEKVKFDFENSLWTGKNFSLPALDKNGEKDYVILVPKEILAKDNTWISENDFLNNDTSIFKSIENEALRYKINKYFEDNLETKLNDEGKLEKIHTVTSRKKALRATAREYPEIYDFYIKHKEDSKDVALKMHHVFDSASVNYRHEVSQLQDVFSSKSFVKLSSLEDCKERIDFFKKTIESNSRRLFIKGNPLQEDQLQLMFKLSTFGSLFDYNSEVNNGRGPIDFIISYGSSDKIGLELKLAKNSKLRQNLLNQGEVYKKDAKLKKVIKLVFYFDENELERVKKVLSGVSDEINIDDVILIDCRKKESASNVK